jgi:hypothetical protein
MVEKLQAEPTEEKRRLTTNWSNKNDLALDPGKFLLLGERNVDFVQNTIEQNKSQCD